MTDKSHEEMIERAEDTIDQTRERVRERINRLQDDFSPKALLDQFVPEGQPISETVRQVSEAARRNPLATALVAGGIALLGKDLVGERASGTTRKVANAGKAYAEDVAGHVREGSEQLAEHASQLADDTRASARKTVSKVKREASHALDQTARAGQELYDSGSQYARTGKRWVEENPVAAGLAAAAAGALIASYFTAKPVSGTRTSDDADPHEPSAPAAKPATRKRNSATAKTTAKTTARRRPPAPPGAQARPRQRRHPSAALQARRSLHLALRMVLIILCPHQAHCSPDHR
jgi:ElaB/YqjD/DUF883 family membrane-anchored ribosome-binding protein